MRHIQHWLGTNGASVSERENIGNYKKSKFDIVRNEWDWWRIYWFSLIICSKQSICIVWPHFITCAAFTESNRYCEVDPKNNMIFWILSVITNNIEQEINQNWFHSNKPHNKQDKNFWWSSQCTSVYRASPLHSKLLQYLQGSFVTTYEITKTIV